MNETNAAAAGETAHEEAAPAAAPTDAQGAPPAVVLHDPVPPAPAASIVDPMPGTPAPGGGHEPATVVSGGMQAADPAVIPDSPRDDAPVPGPDAAHSAAPSDHPLHVSGGLAGATAVLAATDHPDLPETGAVEDAGAAAGASFEDAAPASSSDGPSASPDSAYASEGPAVDTSSAIDPGAAVADAVAAEVAASEPSLPLFSELGLSEPILRAVEEMGYRHPTPIQAQAIPVVLAGRDVLGVAQTGTGKTAGFTLPMLDILAGSRSRARMPRCLILEPTRELALQVAENFVQYGKHLKLNHALLIGGESMNDQKDGADARAWTC